MPINLPCIHGNPPLLLSHECFINKGIAMTDKSKEKIVGILGGMGPEATVDLMQRIIRLTPAQDDIDHVRCIVDNNPKVPSRIKAIVEGTGTDPGPCIADMGRRLETWGADFLAIACNTAHYYYHHIQNAVRIPVINLIDLVVNHVLKTYPEYHSIGVLASTAVLITGLYEKKCKAFGLEVVYPDQAYQERLFGIIRDIKSGNTGAGVRRVFDSVCENLKGKGTDLSIIACTELSVIGGGLSIKTVDAAEILAQEIVDIAKGRKESVDG